VALLLQWLLDQWSGWLRACCTPGIQPAQQPAGPTARRILRPHRALHVEVHQRIAHCVEATLKEDDFDFITSIGLDR
jgi:hypothetical protein